MREQARIAVVIPALNEEHAIGHVLDAIPRWVDDVVVVDNGSRDRTADVARAHGARVVTEPRRGYGQACLTGLNALTEPDIVVFLDGDFSDRPDEMGALVDPIVRRAAELVIGSRTRGTAEPGALTPQARFGNWLACGLMRWFWGARFTDLGPFRAIRFSTLRRLRMRDTNFGWTVEMQVKAAAAAIPCAEVAVRYRRRIGISKISGTLKGVILAGTKILYTIFCAAARARQFRLPPPSPRLICVFTRYPEPGKTKTRLIGALGAEGAADVQRRLTEAVVRTAQAAARRSAADIAIWFAGGSESKMRTWLGGNLPFAPQAGSDLGQRMAGAFRSGFERGYERIVLIGADCPDLTAEILEKAFAALTQHDIVMGPARDGGYYLIGMKRAWPLLFQGVPWGADTVLEHTLAIGKQAGLSIGLMDTLRDVDTAEDLALLRAPG